MRALAALGEVTGPLVVATVGAGGARAAGVAMLPERVLEGPLLGAGDAFADGFLVTFAGGASVTDCLAAGCAAVAVVFAGSEQPTPPTTPPRNTAG